MLIAPPVPAGTMAAFATTLPSNEFNVETSGRAEPAGHAERNDSAPSGTAVTFIEYASAVAGMLHPLAGIWKERVDAAPISGPPNGPFVPRVSAIRHGVTG